MRVLLCGFLEKADGADAGAGMGAHHAADQGDGEVPMALEQGALRHVLAELPLALTGIAHENGPGKVDVTGCENLLVHEGGSLLGPAGGADELHLAAIEGNGGPAGR